MTRSAWHKLYAVAIAAPPASLVRLLADMPNYGQWLPGSDAFGHTTDVDPYPVQYGSRYHDGKPGVAGKDWWGTVTGFQPPGSLDFHHIIGVPQLRPPSTSTSTTPWSPATRARWSPGGWCSTSPCPPPPARCGR